MRRVIGWWTRPTARSSRRSRGGRPYRQKRSSSPCLAAIPPLAPPSSTSSCVVTAPPCSVGSAGTGNGSAWSPRAGAVALITSAGGTRSNGKLTHLGLLLQEAAENECTEPRQKPPQSATVRLSRRDPAVLVFLSRLLTNTRDAGIEPNGVGPGREAGPHHVGDAVLVEVAGAAQHMPMTIGDLEQRRCVSAGHETRALTRIELKVADPVAVRNGGQRRNVEPIPSPAPPSRRASVTCATATTAVRMIRLRRQSDATGTLDWPVLPSLSSPPECARRLDQAGDLLSRRGARGLSRGQGRQQHDRPRRTLRAQCGPRHESPP